MKRNLIRTSILALTFLVGAFDVSAAVPMGTAFTYQGKLADGTNAAGGLYDFRFALYDAASGAGQVGQPVTSNALGVSNGLFTVLLDFGNGAFSGEARWLDIAVKTNGAAAFTWLTPRQPISPAPHALYAPNAGVATLANGTAPNSVNTASLQANSITADKIANGTITVANLSPVVASNTFWQLSGNSGTTPGTSFVGTTDKQPLVLKVNNQAALRLEPTTNGAPNVIGGHALNHVAAGVSSATIAGGGGATGPHYVAAEGGTVGGGVENQALEMVATVAGGQVNVAAGAAATVGGGLANAITNATSATVGGGQLNLIVDGFWGVIGGGIQNRVTNIAATVGGGNQNMAGGMGATVSGGQFNHATGEGSTVVGGWGNRASGGYALAAGHRADASHEGAFVWADLTDAVFASTGPNQFLIRAGGGVGIGVTNPTAALEVAGTVKADSFAGGGMNLSGTLSLPANGLVAGTSQLVLSGGNVGIGTATPQAKLDVDGDLKAARLNVGTGHTLSGEFATIAGGDGNTATGNQAAVGGGRANAATSYYTTVSGGVGNQATTYGTTIGGGNQNLASGDTATVAGGKCNTNSGSYATIAGGYSNSATNDYATIGGGGNNVALGISGTVAGGYGNEAMGQDATVGGGSFNKAQLFSTIAGGTRNLVRSEASAIGGGRLNSIGYYSEYGVIPGGEDNIIQSSRYCVIGGGHQNTIRAAWSTIGGGDANLIDDSASESTISGGTENNVRASASYSTIGGGIRNTIQTNAQFGAIGGGGGNYVQAERATIPGGHSAVARNYGQWAYATGVFGQPGDAQTSQYLLRGEGWSGTDTLLFLDGSGRNLVLPTNAVWGFQMLIVGYEFGLNRSIVFEAKGLIERHQNHSYLYGGAAIPVAQDDPNWFGRPVVTLEADYYDNALVVKAWHSALSGDPPTQMRWLAWVRTVELTHP